MRGGHVDVVSQYRISGWAADSERPGEHLQVCILVNGAEIGRALADQPRQDVAALGMFGASGHGFAFAFGGKLPTGADRVSVCYADDMRPLPGAGELTPLVATPSAAAGGQAGPDPILVSAPGRSGTTYLMGCLAACRSIVVAELVPYEVRLLSYYATAFGVLTTPADTRRSTHPDRLEGDGFHAGFNPFNGPDYAHAFRDTAPLDNYHQRWVPARLGAALAACVREYYRRLSADQGKDGAAFFAEKNNNLHTPTRMFVRRVFSNMREVAIVRDPRDLLCSRMAYFSADGEQTMHTISHTCRQLSALAGKTGVAGKAGVAGKTGVAGKAGANLLVLRYEDLVAGDPGAFTRLSAFLGAEVAPLAADASSAVFRQHATSPTPEASVGRWRRDLPEALQSQSTRRWAHFLEQFGYQT